MIFVSELRACGGSAMTVKELKEYLLYYPDNLKVICIGDTKKDDIIIRGLTRFRGENDEDFLGLYP